MHPIPTRALAGRVRRLAWRLARPGPTRRQERPDFEQDLWAHLVEAWPQYDPARGTEGAFARAVLLRAARSIARTRHAKKRRASEPAPTRDDPEAGAADPPDRASESARVGTEHRLDLAPAVSRMPADLRALADLLETHTVSEAARALGVPRSSLQRTLARLRRHFEAAGLGHYLHPFGTEVAHVRS